MKTTRFILTGIVLTLTVTFCSLTAIRSKAETKDSVRPNCYYTSVKVQLGDTLKSIAKEYNTSDTYSDAAYIDDIKRINTLYTDNIHPGCYLTIMCFE